MVTAHGREQTATLPPHIRATVTAGHSADKNFSSPPEVYAEAGNPSRALLAHHRREAQAARAHAQLGEAKLLHHRLIDGDAGEDDIGALLWQTHDLLPRRQ